MPARPRRRPGVSPPCRTPQGHGLKVLRHCSMPKRPTCSASRREESSPKTRPAEASSSGVPAARRRARGDQATRRAQSALGLAAVDLFVGQSMRTHARQTDAGCAMAPGHHEAGLAGGARPSVVEAAKVGPVLLSRVEPLPFVCEALLGGDAKLLFPGRLPKLKQGPTDAGRAVREAVEVLLALLGRDVERVQIGRAS